MNLWRIMKWVLPLLVVSIGGYGLWNSLWFQTTVIQRETFKLQSQMNDQESYARDVGRLRQSANVLDQFLDMHAVVKTQTTPGIDSLRRLAEKMDLKVLDMIQEKSNPPGYSNMNRLDLEADFSNLVAWLDSLETLQPKLQVERFQWSQGRNGGRLTVFFGEIDPSTVIAKDTSVSVWLARAKYSKTNTLAQVDASAQIRNPFRGNVVERVVVKAAPTIKAAPVQPAPALNVIGLVAGRMATVQMAGGERKLLKVGDSLGNWSVEAITASSLVLRNGDQSKTYTAK